MTTDYRLSDRYEASDGTVMLSGIQALARLPIEQLQRDRARGLDTAAFLSGFPGSPLGGFDLEMRRALRLVPDLPIVLQPGLNEELAATAVMGSQLAATRPDVRYDGVVGFWYGKAPGLDRASDAIRHGVFAGTSSTSGAVALVGDDPAAKSSTMPSSSDATMADLHMPIFYPGTVAECVELGLHAVAASRATGLWSAMKIVTPVADGSGTVLLPLLTEEPVIPTIEVDGVRWEHPPSAKFLGSARMQAVEKEFREVRLPLARRYGVENHLNRVPIDPPDAWIGVVATGFTYYEVIDALRRLGLDAAQMIEGAGIRVLQLRMPVPFDHEIVRRFARGLDEIVVVEEKNPTLERLIKETLYGAAHQPRIVGKESEDGSQLMRSWGRLDADAIIPGLRRRLAAKLDERLAPAPPPVRERIHIPLAVNRTPFFCSGCPHSWGTKAPTGSLVGAGTGCHGMSMLMDADRVGESIGGLAMGNEGANWIGMEPFVETNHLFQNVGDGTFFHSGQLAVQFAVSAGTDMTFKILYNGTVAMTGGQDAQGTVGIPELSQILLGYGVKKVAITTDDPDRYRDVQLPDGVRVHDRRTIIDVQDDLASIPGVTALINDQECAAELRRARRRGLIETPTTRVVINHRICEGCGDCGDVSGCLSVQPVETPFGRKTRIDQPSCNFDYSCVEGDCPAFMLVNASHAPEAVAFQPGPVPQPVLEGDGDLLHIRLAGIGGTGVVTAAQILATAAMFDGWDVRGLDQTGLSQKAGPVISDITLARGAGASNLVGDGQADVLLGFDALVAASDDAISAADAERTVVVASTHETPTGPMISHPAIRYPSPSALAGRFADRSRSEHNRFVDASAIATALVGTPTFANVFMLGVAVQAGVVPVSVDAIVRAIGLNGVAVDGNERAFAWGRQWAHAPDDVERAAARVNPWSLVTVPDLPPDLDARVTVAAAGSFVDRLALLTADLVGYQDPAYAARYLDAVEEMAEAEARSVPGTTEFTEAFAASLHKLMAYKDEYEVARLATLPEASAAVETAGGRRASFEWKLHPPLLKALGMREKMTIGRWGGGLFRTLERGKRLRGTKLDPFGHTKMRRLERALPGEFVDSMRSVAAILGPDNHATAIEAARLPDLVRGYEDLKLRRIAEYREQLAGILSELGT